MQQPIEKSQSRSESVAFLSRRLPRHDGGPLSVGIDIDKAVYPLFVFKLFFFPDLLKRDYDNDRDRAQAVRTALTDDRR